VLVQGVPLLANAAEEIRKLIPQSQQLEKSPLVLQKLLRYILTI
jgi:hypothetical protein